MEQALIKAIESAPSALITLGIIFLIVFLIREYRKVRSETEESVKTLVNAKLGEIMTNIQSEASRVELLSSEQAKKLSTVEDRFTTFLGNVEEKTERIDRLYIEANEKLTNLKEAIPNVDEYSATDILVIANSKGSSQAKAELCSKILLHNDATSRDLELAGDLMKDNNRYSLALKLYEAAVEKDPERIGAFAEYMSLRAIIDAKSRDESLKLAESRVVGQPHRNAYSTVANALMSLERYEELRKFSLEFISELNDRDLTAKALALRCIAISYKDLGDIEQATVYFNQAFQIAPEDPNVMKPYLGILEEQGRNEEYLATTQKMVEADPTEIQYWRLLINALIKNNNFEEALEKLRIARQLPMSQSDSAALERYELRVKIAAG